MASDAPQYPILVDTDALIAVANSSLWDRILAHIGLTTTNVCQQELKRHRSRPDHTLRREAGRIVFTTAVCAFSALLRIQRRR